MASYGGDITEITCNNPNVGSLIMFGKSSEDSTYDLGGIRTGDDANMIDGAGNAIYQKNRVRPSFMVKMRWDMLNSQELEFLSAVTADPSESVWTFTNINGTIYKITGTQVGDLNGNGNSSTIDLKVSGSGTMQII